ncbi:MAG: transporter substrate-binding domain-containing protein [Ardenticatenaceae bacterium]|nr:transporter substrate-binding domain-containing protein [Ardenticatenaceae bacterium]
MMKMKILPNLMLLWLAGWLLVGCMEQPDEVVATAVPPTPTSEIQPTASTAPVADDDFLIVATSAPDPPFTDFDAFGEVVGFNKEVMASVAALAGFEGYEFVVTPYEGVLDSIAQQTTDDFDAVMSVLVIPEQAPEGIAYTLPYLEIGQVLVVLADNTAVQSYVELPGEALVGVQQRSRSEEAARQVMGLDDGRLQLYANNEAALQALINEEIQAVVVDNYTGKYYTERYPEQLRLVGGTSTQAWLSSKQFGIALAAKDTELQQRLDDAIVQLQANGTMARLATDWFVAPQGQIDPGESRVGTAVDELVIGMVGQPDMDPASAPDLISWEVKNNTMSGLYMFTAQNELMPVLAVERPSVSTDKLEYTIQLREGLFFADGSALNGNVVRESVLRSARLGNFLVNGLLKDSNDDGFADEDAVQVLGQNSVKFVLQEPTGYFPNILATPPYYPINPACYAAGFDATSTCGGIGPYMIESWVENEMALQANPQWPGSPVPAFANIRLRFFADAVGLQNALVNFQSVDVAWGGLAYGEMAALAAQDGDGDGTDDFTLWPGSAIFKSYLLFDQATPPWDSKQVRQAVAYAVDRQAIVDGVFGDSRQTLFSPVPDAVPGHVNVFPNRDLARARALLLQAGYSEAVPLPITLWFIDDGRYSAVEAQYAEAIKTQLEETNVFQVTLQSAPWEVYQTQIFSCGYDFYLMGWPSPGTPPNYLHVTSWTDFFLGEGGFCMNYDSAAMAALNSSAQEELDDASREGLYRQMQTVWADDVPTLDLTQEPRWAIALPNIGNVQMDAMGLMHYELLTKEVE